MKKNILFTSLLLSALCFTSFFAFSQNLYQYKDKNGTITLVDSINKVPPEYRDQVILIEGRKESAEHTNPSLNSLPNPAMLQGMKNAAEKVKKFNQMIQQQTKNPLGNEEKQDTIDTVNSIAEPAKTIPIENRKPVSYETLIQQAKAFGPIIALFFVITFFLFARTRRQTGSSNNGLFAKPLKKLFVFGLIAAAYYFYFQWNMKKIKNVLSETKGLSGSNLQKKLENNEDIGVSDIFQNAKDVVKKMEQRDSETRKLLEQIESHKKK